jgi:hypothetical protein
MWVVVAYFCKELTPIAEKSLCNSFLNLEEFQVESLA